MLERCLCLALILCLSPVAYSATFIVDSTLDTPDTSPGNGICEATSGGTQCTLRAAIEEANASAGFDEITFSLALGDINVSGSALPAITSSMRIDGSTASTYNTSADTALGNAPAISIDGDGLAGTPHGISINTDEHVEIIAIAITGFAGNGILVVNNTSCLIDSNWIGTTRGGSAKGNGTHGIYLQNVQDCVIGQEIVGTSILGRGNVISNNTEEGVHIDSGTSSGIVIGGNYIGEDAIGDSDHGNGGHGIEAIGTFHEIGQFRTTAPALETGNLITHNGGDGAHIGGVSSLYSNVIRTNDGNGMYLRGPDATAGSSYEHSRNTLEANKGHGLYITDPVGVDRVVARSNWAFNNLGAGIYVENGDEINLIENSIWNNLGDAIYLDATNSDVWGNLIGTAADPSGNAGNGIQIEDSDNTIASNTIGGVDENGILVANGTGNQILNNYLGTDDSYADLGNISRGLRVSSTASETLISGNSIGHNGSAGITVDGSAATTIEFNFIGSGAAGQSMGNSTYGIHATAPSTSVNIFNNVIGHNLLDGVLMDASGSKICGNWIGLGQGYEDAGNAVEGILLRGDSNRVGDPNIVCGGNRFGFNNSDGIQVEGDNNIFRGNYFGGEVVDGISTNFGNTQGGILLTRGADSNTVRGNVMRHNGDHGVRVSTTALESNAIRQNDFRFNGGMAIDLQLDGTTPNDPGDGDAGPNKLQNTPEFDLVQSIGAELQITYRVNSDSTNAKYPIFVDVYISKDNEREGEWAKQSIYSVAANSQWQTQFEPAFAKGYVMAMATDGDGNSSELSAPVAFEVDLIFVDGFED